MSSSHDKSSCGLKNNKNNDEYQKALNSHYSNADRRITSDQLIYETISLANLKTLTPVAWRHNRPEDHPAFLKLCTYWDVVCKGACMHSARVPYIQVFLGRKEYIPLIESGDNLPIHIEEVELHKTMRESSVIFEEHFLITFLADRQFALKDEKLYLVHYTVYDKPFLLEPFISDEFNEIGIKVDLKNQLAWQTLNGLHQFPMRFPLLWQQLKKKHEVGNYGIH